MLSELTLTSPSPHSEYTWKKGLVGTQREREAHQNPPAFHKEEGGGPGVAEKGREGRRGQQNLGMKLLRTEHHQEESRTLVPPDISSP